MATNQTVPTNNSVQDFIDAQPELRRQDSIMLVEIMRDVTGLEPVMWGPSIVGFGSYHYKYASGREGDVPISGFSPRKANMTIYLGRGFDSYEPQLAKLGKHKTSLSCLYINKLSDVDLGVLREIIEADYRHYASKPQ